MRFRRVAEIVVILVFTLVSLFFLLGRDTRNHLLPYFSTRCLDYRQKDYSRRLNDRLVDYAPEARRKGIAVCTDEKSVSREISEGKLVKIRSGRTYQVEKMNYSHPYLTPAGRDLLDEIGRRFRSRTSSKGIRGARFFITSMTRTGSDLKRLRKFNFNSSENSPHLYGNAFDISYKRFTAHKWVLTNCDQKFLKDVLGEVIWQLRAEGKCYATYERIQNCFHVVAR